MNRFLKAFAFRSTVSCFATALFYSGFVNAASMADYTAIPPEYDQNAPPLVMLSVSAHEGLFTKAYDDYSDIDGDGNVETSYENSIEYQGLFDPDICYSYGSGRFSPSSAATNHQCGGSGWSGNFLNWATMTRMDVLRAGLYGGKRSSDPAAPDFDSVLSVAPTILERALIPPDGHAFAKVFTSASVSQYVPTGTVSGSSISLCNVTPSIGSASVESGSASTTLFAPAIYVASGSYPRWASHGGTPCDTDGTGLTRPTSTGAALTARVEACVKSIEIGNTERCKAYGSAYKPVGVLQKYGETEALRFGLFSGSFDKNAGGGALRRNIKPLVGNDDVADNEVDTATGVFLNTTSEGVISTLNRMRISKYDFGSKRYEDCIDDNYGGGLFGAGADDEFLDKSEFLNLSGGFLGLGAAANESDEDCADWGNPVAEMMYEVLRYFSNAGSASNDFDADDSSFIPTLNPVNWEDPITANDACADCAQVVISVGSPTFDAYDTGDSEYDGGIIGLTGAPTSQTNAVGTDEGISGTYLSPGTDVDDFCDDASVSGGALANLRGSCPDQPLLESGFFAAGIAKHAATTDLRSDRSRDQTVATYAVQMGKDVPTFSFQTAAGNTAKFTPVCYTTKGSDLPCALVDAVVIDAPNDNSVEIEFRWHSQRWGKSYRTELVQTVQVQVVLGSSRVTSTLTGSATTGTVHHGVVLEDTGNDGTHQTSTAVDTITVVESLTPGAKLENPLWYAAKYGAFIDGNNNDEPDVTSEWDRYDVDGNASPDGIPDNFFDLTNSGQFRDRLNTIFSRIVDRAQSEKEGLADVVINGGVVGNRLFVQSYYYPVYSTFDGDGLTTDSVDWVGGVHGLFLDSSGFIREDNGDGVLGDFTDDPIVNFIFDESESSPSLKIRRYTSADLSSFTEADFTDLNPVWSAQNVLADISDVTTQREYTADAGTGRHIFTWIDLNQDGVVDETLSTDNEVLDFTAASFPLTDDNFRYLGITLPTEAANIVNYIRGEEISGKRSRSIDFVGDTAEDVWRLGDIVNSVPAVVAAPQESYDVFARDDTYTTFRQQYTNRRQMIYVGGNDGLLHAFNGGVWNASTRSFQSAGHTLGAEMWAYAPMNLLPHLQWLSDEAYSHVFYVDGSVQAFDVNIFPADETHPGGWGTILVVGMRLGGGEFPIDTDGDLTDDTSLRSAYVILDVTDPESPPELIAEITDPSLGFTTSAPALVKQRKPSGGSFNSPSVNNWVLVFGSGATELTDVTSTQTNELFAYDLVSRTRISVHAGIQSAIAESNSFTGDIRSHDWDNDLVDDNLYFGTIGGTPASPVGTLKQVTLDTSATNLGLSSSASASELLNPSRPIQARPSPINDLVDGSKWVLFGTGRYLEGDDKLSTAAQRYYGLKIPASGTASDFLDVTDIETDATGAVTENGAAITFLDGGGLLGLLPTVVETFSELRNYIRNNKDGWYYDFDVPAGQGAERNLSDTVFFGSVALFTSYQPDGELCDANGEGFLYGLDAYTGIAPPFGPFGFDSDTNYARKVVSLGAGRPSPPQLVRTSEGTKALIQGSDGEVHEVELTGSDAARGRKTWKEIEIEDDDSLF